MSRELTSTNVTQITAAYLDEVLLCDIAFASGTVYVHSGYGEIDYDSNTYIGVGDFGSIGAVREQAPINPTPITLNLSGINPMFVDQILDSANYKSDINLYVAYRQDDGALADDPWLVWSGWLEFASVSLGDVNGLTITAQHDLSVLDEINGSRFSDEDQQEQHSGDVGLEYVVYMADLNLPWAGGAVGSITGTPFGGVGVPGGGRDELRPQKR